MGTKRKPVGQIKAAGLNIDKRTTRPGRAATKAAGLKIVGRSTRPGPSPTEAARLKTVRAKIAKEFPPARVKPAVKLPELAAALRSARELQGLTWYALAKQAGIPNPNTVRDMELGRDVLLSNLESVARVLGLSLQLSGLNGARKAKTVRAGR